MFKRILIPYDGSNFSKKAMDVAIEISKKFGSELWFFTVLDKDIPPRLTKPVIEDSKKSKTLKSLSSIELELRNKVLDCKDQGSCADYEIIKGSPIGTILRFAKKKKMDLIIMGSQGLHGINKIKSLGSVSRAVSEKSECPVLLIH
jgi:nucleotide-binding universal stress UspA family protein